MSNEMADTPQPVDSRSPLARLVLRDDRSGVEIVEGQGAAEVDAAVLVPPPEVEGQVNLASEGAVDGAVVAVSSIIWGHKDAVGRQKLRNVLRPGAKHGAPRFQHESEDCSFIFSENDPAQWLVLDLGATYSLTRVGATGYADRWLDSLTVVTALSCQLSEGTSYPEDGVFVGAKTGDLPKLEGNVTKWGEFARRPYGRRPTSKPHFFDSEDPVDARFILFRVSSGHYYGAGARLGPLFAWGSPGWWSPETHASFPPAFQDVSTLIQLVRQARVPSGEEEHPMARLPPHLWRKIFGHFRRSDWKTG